LKESTIVAPKIDSSAAWNEIVDAARREKFDLASMRREKHKKVMAIFRDAFPHIRVEYPGARQA